MKKRILAFVLLLALVMSGLGHSFVTTLAQPIADLPISEPIEFVFSSDTGRWSTFVTLNSDGTFSGNYIETNWWDTGSDHPYGTLIQSVFIGRFTNFRRISDLEYAMNLAYLNIEGVIGEERVVDGVLIITTEPFGFHNANEFRLYIPGIPTDTLPEEFLYWVSMPLAWGFMGRETPERLPFYGLYNVDGMAGFFSAEVDPPATMPPPLPDPPMPTSGISVSYLIEPIFEFDQVFPFSEGLAGVEYFLDELGMEHILGYINHRGEMVIPIDYRHFRDTYYDLGAPPFTEGRVIVFSQDHNSIGIFDREGRQIVPFGLYTWGWLYAEGLAVVQQSWTYSAVIDLDGNVVVPFGRYVEINDFSEGLAAVNVAPHRTGIWTSGQWGFIDRNGNEVIPTIFDLVGDFSEGLAPVKRDGLWGFIDTSGNVVIPFQFEGINDLGMESLWRVPSGFHEGVAAIWHAGDWLEWGYRDSSWGFIDTMGDEVVPFRYNRVESFSEGLAIVNYQGWLPSVLDRVGNIVVPTGRYNSIRNFSEGLAAVMTGDWQNPRWGFVDREGNEVIVLQFNEARDFSQGLAAVNAGTRDNPRWGFIDRHGNIVVEPQYSDAQSFSEGLAWVNAGTRENPRWGIIQIVEPVLVPGEYDHTPVAPPRLFAPAPRIVADVTNRQSAATEIESAIRALTAEQRASGDALGTIALHIEQVERRGTTQTLPQGGTLSVEILRSGSSIAREIQQSTENMLEDEDVHLMRRRRINLNFVSDEFRSVSVEFPTDVGDVAFDNVTIESLFAAATVNRACVAQGGILQLDRVERLHDNGEQVAVTFGDRAQSVLQRDRSFVDFLLDFWAFAAIVLMLAVWIILAILDKRLRLWVVPVFACVAIIVNAVTLWASYDPEDHVDFYNDIIEVNMTDGMRATLSLPVDGIEGDPMHFVLFNEHDEPQYTKFNPVTGTADARIRAGGVYTLREHRVIFADIDDKSQLMQDAILTLAARGIMRGVTEEEFGPDDFITRSQFVSMVIMAFDMLNLEAESQFTDMSPVAWYYQAVATAENEGLVVGFPDDTFRGSMYMPKDQMTVIAANTLVEQMGYIIPTDIEPILARYLDRDEIEVWAEGGVALATASNVLIFRVDSLFAPNSVMTRGDAAIVLYRLFNRVW